MKVSVVIPAYNEEEYIGQCLRALSSQTEPPDEIIVVDNNSTDKTAEIAVRHGARVITEKKQGMIPARNAGFNAAQYEIIARTDADTVVAKNWIQMLKNGFLDPHVVAISGRVTFRRKIWHMLTADIFFSSLPNKLLYGYEMPFGPNMALLKSAWEKIRDKVCLDDRAVHEDLDVGIHLSKIGKISYDRQMLVTTSARRVEDNLKSALFEYPYRWLKTVWRHRLGYVQETGHS